MPPIGPHAGLRIAVEGAPFADAAGVMIMVHGRGAAPEHILSLVEPIERPSVAYLAPAANGGAWYPYSFMAPRERNEPDLSSGLSVLDSMVADLMQRGFASRRIMLLGFSQGACLAAEFVLRHPRRYGGLLVLSGGVIGAPGTTWDDVTASFDGTPVFLGCSDVDPHIPKERVLESEALFTRLGAVVTRRLYPGMGHAVNEDEIGEVRRVVDGVLSEDR
jgi:predicted esterase